MSSDDRHYVPKDAISATVKASLITGGAGLFISGVQNTLTKQNVGALGIFTRTGSTITTFAAVGAAQMFTKTAAANLREKDDAWNAAIGGFFGGTMVGLRYRTLPAVIGCGAALSVLLGAFEYTGGSLSGFSKDPSVDEVARKEFLRKNRRRPIEETLSELGEGRGVYGPGYEERRRQRIKQNYGVDINPGVASPSA